jgi:hypothetical protein
MDKIPMTYSPEVQAWIQEVANSSAFISGSTPVGDGTFGLSFFRSLTWCYRCYVPRQPRRYQQRRRLLLLDLPRLNPFHRHHLPRLLGSNLRQQSIVLHPDLFSFLTLLPTPPHHLLHPWLSLSRISYFQSEYVPAF